MDLWKYDIEPHLRLTSRYLLTYVVDNCLANPGFQVTSIDAYEPTLSGQANWFVGYDQPKNEIIVSLADVGPEQLYVNLFPTWHSS